MHQRCSHVREMVGFALTYAYWDRTEGPAMLEAMMRHEMSE